MTPNDYKVLTDFILEQGFKKIKDKVAKINFTKKRDVFITANALENSLLFSKKTFLIFINRETNAGFFEQKERFGTQVSMFSLKPQSMINTISKQTQKTEKGLLSLLVKGEQKQ